MARTEQLVAAAQRGVPGSLDELAELCVGDLRCYVRLNLSPELRAREASVDIVQSVCREMIEGLDNFENRGAGSFRAWLFAATLNKIRKRHDYWHAQKREVTREVDPGVGSDASLHASLCSLAPSPSEEAIGHELARKIEHAVARLEPEQREVLILNRLIGLTHREIAGRLGRTEVAVRSILSRARVRLLAVVEGRR